MPTILCIQRKAKKIIPNEDDIIQANKLAFNDDIGIITNHVTSMFEVQAGFPSDSEEYKTLEYRIMCGQLYQQNSIDRAKGIIAKNMPPYWHTLRDNRIEEDDSEELADTKEFNFRIAATRKPYFMIYVYPKLRKETRDYTQNNDKDVIRRYARYGISGMEELEQADDKTPEMEERILFYRKHFPVGTNSCTVNRISWFFESAFDADGKSISKGVHVPAGSEFDYRILKSGVDYSIQDYRKISELYQEYESVIRKNRRDSETEKAGKEDELDCIEIYKAYFMERCSEICPNEAELCDIILDMCYRKESIKQFAWDMCGGQMIRNLLNRSGDKIQYPVVSDDNPEFYYCGIPFHMEQQTIGGYGYQESDSE